MQRPAAPIDEIVLCAYNVEHGLRMDDQLSAFFGDGGVPTPDVLLISEADRGCTRSGNRNVARDYARALDMYYVYGVEFIELPRFWGPGGGVRHRCEHGNAIVSRFPLGNVELIRHFPTGGDASYPGLVSPEPGRLAISYYSDVAYWTGTVKPRHFSEWRYKSTECDIYLAELNVPE